jgi:hypothetical protein
MHILAKKIVWNKWQLKFDVKFQKQHVLERKLEMKKQLLDYKIKLVMEGEKLLSRIVG